jgi:hypothetical protein
MIAGSYIDPELEQEAINSPAFLTTTTTLDFLSNDEESNNTEDTEESGLYGSKYGNAEGS